MKGIGEKQALERLKNYNLVLEVLKDNLDLKASEIMNKLELKNRLNQLKKGHKEKNPTLRTVYRILQVMINRKIVRKKGLHYVYAPHDILRKRWLDYFDRLFRSYTAAGYSIQEFLNSQAFIITPLNLGFAPANSESLKTLAEGLFDNPDLKPGEMLGLIRTAGKIEKYQPVRWVRKDESK